MRHILYLLQILGSIISAKMSGKFIRQIRLIFALLILLSSVGSFLQIWGGG